jgi:hypothetical protein
MAIKIKESELRPIELTDIEAALQDLQFARESHAAWAVHLEAHEQSGESCPDCDSKPYKLNAAHEREWVAKYDRLINIVRVAALGYGAE